MKVPPDLILVADGMHARMIAHESRGDTVLWTMHCREQQRTGPMRAAQLAFAREVADKVEETLVHASFNKFVVVAPPRTVGDLRREFCDQVLDALTTEIEKDLVGLPDSDIVAQLKQSSARH
jgi:protein required for attachment to host cells